jgi:hypothetical protein
MRFKLTLRHLKHDCFFAQALLAVAVAVFVPTGKSPAHHAIAATFDLDRPVTMVAWPAPVGHRQPSAGDISSGNPASPSGVDMLNRELTRKMMICRGC